MNKKHFKDDNKSQKSSTLTEQNMSLRPPDDGGDPPIDPPPGGSSVSLNQVSPLAGAIAGGISITLTGSGFQPGAAVYFGNAPATQVTVESGEVIRAVSPAASATGSVAVSVINPDGTSASIPGSFTYVTGESGDQAEVIGVTPLAVIEDTNTVVTIRGRNLIAAYNSGVLALRGPSRCQITFLGTTTNYDAASGIDTVQMNVNIKCVPGLQPLERMAVQVLASRRAEAANDGVVESSKQMFTVLPKAVPVTLAYTANLDAGKSNLVMVSGRNLNGHSLALDDGTEIAFQKNDGNFISGIVNLPENVDTSSPLQLSMLDSGGTKVAEYQMEVAPDSGFVSLNSEQNYASLAQSPDELSVNFTPAPNQQFIGPTANDSAAFSVSSGSPLGFGFNWGNFAITIVDVTIILPIVNEVYLIPFFDGGGDIDSPVLAEVGKIFRLRGTGLLVAIRVEVRIHIQVVLIIGFYYQIWDYGFYNEFPEFGWSIGSVVIGIEINIEILFSISLIAAIVQPNGQLYLIAKVNLEIDIDFSIDNGHLHFDPQFTHSVNIIGINPAPNNPMPCGNKFELLPQNGLTAVPDEFGFVAQYAVHEAGDCCLPWDFNVRLLRFSSNGQQEVVQEGFQTSYCLTAVQPPAIEIKPTLAYLDAAGNLVSAADGAGNIFIDRSEPHETQRQYVLAAKVTSPTGNNSAMTVNFPSVSISLNSSPLSMANGREPIPDRSSSAISDFFTGDLINRTSLSLTIPANANPNLLYRFNNATIQPNHKEDPASGLNLVPPGKDVTGKDVVLKVVLVPSNATSSQQPSANTGDNLVFSVKDFNCIVRNEETYEEYYRVFKEIRAILHTIPLGTTPPPNTNPTLLKLDNFAKDFQAELKAHGFDNLISWGRSLWKYGYEFVQGIGAAAVIDDRLLYYARLEAISVLRNYWRQQNPATNLTDEKLNLFELPSRGLETTNGKDAYIKFETNESNRVVVTGFDPFQLYLPGNLLISNSSGLIALDRHQRSITAGKSFTIRTAVLPVRFRDFGNSEDPRVDGLIEKIMRKAVEDSVLIMTCSWTFDHNFHIDRFATRYRTTNTADNDGLKSKTNFPLGQDLIPSGSDVLKVPYYIESTLPYMSPGVLNSNDSKTVTGPYNPTYLLLDQSYKLLSYKLNTEKPGSYRKSPQPNSEDSYKLKEVPNYDEVEFGSGGNYLSNEIFYRTSRVRKFIRATLPSGHLHVPTIGTTPEVGGPNLITGAKEILNSMLPHAVSLTGTVQIGFPDTLVNSSGATRTITVDVPADYPNEVKISSVEFSQSPSAFQIAPFSTIAIQPGASATIEVKFVPTEVKEYVDAVKLRDLNDSVLQIVELRGKGIAAPTRINSFSPTSGTEGTMVTIYGENFVDVADVRIGYESVPFTVDSPTQITAEVTYGVQTGFISIDTNAGTAQSATMFRIIRSPRDPYDPYNV